MTAVIDFPTNPAPTNGDTYTPVNGITYTYQDGKWNSIPIPGYTGSKGEIGYSGSQGNTGPQGVSVNILGSVATTGDLPGSGQQAGDAWIVAADGDMYFWDVTLSTWDNIGKIVGYAGSKGDTGANGADGYTGSKGDIGYTGSQGPIGYTGSQGVDPSYTFADDSASASWYLLGTWNTVQSGQTLYMRIISHSGYNGVANQNQVTELMWSASNGYATYNGSTGSPMYGAGQASVNSRLGTGGGSYSSPSVFRMVQVSSTQYQVYGYFGSYTCGSTYSVQTSSLCSWVHSGTVVSAPTGNYIAITPSTF